MRISRRVSASPPRAGWRGGAYDRFLQSRDQPLAIKHNPSSLLVLSRIRVSPRLRYAIKTVSPLPLSPTSLLSALQKGVPTSSEKITSPAMRGADDLSRKISHEKMTCPCPYTLTSMTPAGMKLCSDRQGHSAFVGEFG